MGSQDQLIENIISRCRERSDAGIRKYGVGVRGNPHTDPTWWISEAQEELWDGIVYLERLKEILNENRDRDTGS